MFASLIRIHSRQRVILLTCLLFAGVALYLTWGNLPTGAALWPDTSVAIQLGIGYLGPLGAGVAAWLAIRERRFRMTELVDTTPYPALRRQLAPWIVVSGSVLLAYALNALVVGLWTAVRATWGGPDAAPIAHGVLALLTYCTLGHVLGHWMGNRWAPLIAMLIIVLVHAFGPISFPFESPILNFIPIESWRRSLLYYPSSELFVGQLLWLGGITLGLWALLLARHTQAWQALLLGMVALGCIGLGATRLLALEAFPHGAERVWQPVCDEGILPVCAHPAYQRELPGLAPIIRRLLAPLEGVPGGPTRALVSQEPGRLEADGTLIVFYFDDNSTWWALPTGIAGTLFGSREPNDALAVLQAWYLEESAGIRLGVTVLPEPNPDAGRTMVDYASDPYAAGEAYDRWVALSDAARHAWLVANYQALRDGELSLDDLP